MPRQTKNSQIGAENRQERANIKTLLITLKGQAIADLTTKQKDTLLIALCIALGFADKHGTIR